LGATRLNAKNLRGFIEYLRERRVEDKFFMRWIAGPQFQVGFEEFKHSCLPPVVRPDEEILQELYSNFEKAGIK